MKKKRATSFKSLVVFKRLAVGPVEIRKDRVSARYELTGLNGETASTCLIYKYDEAVFNPDDPLIRNLASVMSAQVAINYGLFCREIVFDGLFDDIDRRFILDMTENTSREIYVNKILFPNEFLKEEVRNLQPVQQRVYTRAKISFVNLSLKNSALAWKPLENSWDRYVILSSGGKDSLLSYGVMREIKKEVHPVFINESGRHWFTALNAFRSMEKADPNTVRVWCNCDRIYTWMLRRMPFIRQDFSCVRADMYPIRLWTVAVFIFGALPIALRRKAGRILIGDEYDCTQKMNYKGITHYNSLYDQSKYFDNALTRYYLKKGWGLTQFSVVRSLSELLIEKILATRYPDLHKLQVSCHAAHEKGGRIYPCGKCEKCRRIVGMVMALGKDPAACGYSKEQVKTLLKQLSGKSVKQIGSDAAHLYYLLLKKNLIEQNNHTRKLAKDHPEILSLRFDREKSLLSDMPEDIRSDMLEIFLKHAKGAVTRDQDRWVEIDILNSSHISQPYPFEISRTARPKQKFAAADYKEFLWEKLTWEEIVERTKYVDTAILPCGSIEQHGPHLPVDVDYYDIVYLARKVADACSPPKPFLLPSIPYGVSYHHGDFKGTLSITNNALSMFVYDIGMSLAHNGIRKLIILNGHGDNAPTLNYAAQMINRDARIFVCVETGETSDTDISTLVETPNDVHAGEIETSTTLALRPEAVKMERAVNATLKFGSKYLDFSSTRGVPWYVRTKKLSKVGIMGNPTKATAEKGRRMWEIMIAHLVRFVEEVKSSRVEDLFQKKY